MTKLEQAMDPNTSPEILVGLLGDIRSETSYSEEYFHACRNPNLPASVMEDIARNGTEGRRWELCGNPNLSATAFELLRQGEAMWGNLALNPSTPAWFLVTAARSGASGARANAAGNLNTPISVLMELIRDVDGYVRDRLLRNPKIPDAVLWILSTDDSETVRANLYYQPLTPPALRLQMASIEQSEFVKKWMTKCQYTPPSVKMWLQGGYGDLSLEGFLEATGIESNRSVV